MIQVTVAGMILDQQTQSPILLLHIPPLDRYLPVWIGSSEAASITMAIKGQRFERPLTHDLTVTIIDGLDGRVQKVTITELRGNTFIARIYIERGQQVIGIDARPSDSIAIALRAGSPIYVSEGVVEREGDHLLRLDEESARRLFDRGVAGLEGEADEPDEPDEPDETDEPDEPDDLDDPDDPEEDA